MVAVASHAMRVQTAGLDSRAAGQPIVVFQNGGGSALETWGHVPARGALLWYRTEHPAEIAAIRAADPGDEAPPAAGAEGMVAEAKITIAWLTHPPDDARLLPASDLPIAILLATPPPPNPSPPPGAPSYLTADWARAFQAHKVTCFVAQLRGRAHGTLLVATDAGHFVFQDDPQLAIEAVRRVIAAVVGGG